MRAGGPLSCLLIDLDDFKLVNDRHGHQAGDAVLREVVQALVGEFRAFDRVARYGGDEFVVILPNADLDSAAAAAARALERLMAVPAARRRRRHPGLDRRGPVALADGHRRAARSLRRGAAALQAPGQGPRHARPPSPSLSGAGAAPDRRAPRLCETAGMAAADPRTAPGDVACRTNSFGAKDTLEVGGREYEIFRLDALQQRFDVARLPFSLKVLLENLLRTEGNGSVDAADIEALASWDAKAQPSKEIAFTPGARADAGLHRRARGRRPRRDARRDGGDGRRPRARSTRSLPAELVIDHSVQVDAFGTARRLPRQRRARVRAQPRALRVPALGPGRVRRLRGRAARHRHRPPGQPRVPRARRVRRRADRAGLPGHARRHRLAHDDGQRPRRARLGRRRHRGGGGDARPADVDADPAGARLPAARRAAARARPRPTSC